jgi:hypothetical protein
MNRFVLNHKVKTLNVDGEIVNYLRLGKKTVFLDIPIQDGTIGYFLKNVELKEIDDYHYKIMKGDKNIFIIEYVFNTGDWCGLSNCITPHRTAFNYWVKDDWGFIHSSGIVVETDKDYVLVEKFRKKSGVWNKTEIEYIFSDNNDIKIIEFDINKINK